MQTSESTQKMCLIVEDNAPAADLMKIYLGRQGISSDIATDGGTGLNMFLDAPTKYHIVFLDIKMPVLDGYEVARGIRESGAENALTIPIIAMSGTTTGEVSANNSFSYFLRKPFEFRSLDDVLRRLLQA